jgi:hypothetical protein
MATNDHPAAGSPPQPPPPAPAPGPRREQPRENVGARHVGRAAFIGIVAAGVGTLFAGSAISRIARRVTQPVTDGIGLADVIPSGGWRIYTVAASMPRFEPISWRLGVGGLVDRPLSLSYDELRALPHAEQVSTFHCVTGWVVPNVRWRGVRIGELLKLAGAQPAATALRFTSAEQPYVDSLTRAQALLPDVLLAYEMDGKPLPRAHGAPLRLVIPDMYGYKNVKWVSQIDLVTQAEDGYWEVRGYDRDAWVGRSNGA